MVLAGIRGGASLVRHALAVFRAYPRFLLPLLGVWVVIAAMDLWLYFAPGGRTPLVVVVPAALLLAAVLLTSASSVVLELVEQVETGRRPSLRLAVRHSVSRNLLRYLPLAVAWSVVWLALAIVEAILSQKDDDADRNYSPETAARVLAGDGGSIWTAGIDAIQKGVRMVVFLMMPAIAWEERGLVSALGRGREILGSHPSTFVTGYSLTSLVSAVVFLPVGALFAWVDAGNAIPDLAWYGVIAYVGLSWSFVVYLEQLFTAGLYLWHLEWERAAAAARLDGDPVPTMADVPRPSLLDDETSLAVDSPSSADD